MTGLGFELTAEAGGDLPVWRVTVPSWRWYDVPAEPANGGEVYEADLFEEVLRHLGFDRIPTTLPAVPGSDGPRTPEQLRRDRVRDHFAACGYAEAIDYAFGSREADAALPAALAPGDAVALTNPLSERYAVLRRSLLPNLLDAARFNRRRGAPAVRLFEIGHVFWRNVKGGVSERETVALVAGGRVGSPWDREVELDLFDLKGAIDTLGEALATPLASRPAELAGLVPGTAAEILAGGELAGWLGQVDDREGDGPLYAAELATGALGSGAGDLDVVVPSRFPGVEADLTLTHSRRTAWAELRAAVEENRPADLASFGLKDRYAGEGVPEGAVNTTLGFLYLSAERSLTQDEVNERQAALRADSSAASGGPAERRSRDAEERPGLARPPGGPGAPRRRTAARARRREPAVGGAGGRARAAAGGGRRRRRGGRRRAARAAGDPPSGRAPGRGPRGAALLGGPRAPGRRRCLCYSVAANPW